MTDPTIVTLSTIPPRFGDLGLTLRSLLAQSLPVAEIRVYIPHAYRRFPDWDGSLPRLPEGVRLHRCETDYGPATKLLPAMRDLDGKPVDILVCDDDLIYDRNWHRRMKTLRQRMPKTCIVEAGETFPDIADSVRPADRLPRGRRRRKGVRYRMIRGLTLTMHKPHIYEFSGYVDQISAYGGVMVRPGWLDEAAFHIPDILWTVDDPWFSGHFERLGVPIWLNARGRAPASGPGARRFALQHHVEQGHDRVLADLAAIDYFRTRYGIWTPGGEVEPPSLRMTASMRELARRALAGRAAERAAG